MRLPNLSKLHVHPCHYGAVVHPALRGGSRVFRPGVASKLPVSYLLFAVYMDMDMFMLSRVNRRLPFFSDDNAT